MTTITLKSDDGRVFVIPIDIAMQNEKKRTTGFIARKEAEYQSRYKQPRPEVVEAKRVNDQYQHWMKTVENLWSVKDGGVMIVILECV